MVKKSVIWLLVIQLIFVFSLAYFDNVGNTEDSALFSGGIVQIVGMSGLYIFFFALQYLFLCFWSIVGGIVLLRHQDSSWISYASATAFFPVSILNIMGLLYVISETPLKEAALGLILFPIYGALVTLGGVLIGSLAYFIKRDSP